MEYSFILILSKYVKVPSVTGSFFMTGGSSA